jgi:hypothetical protein
VVEDEVVVDAELFVGGKGEGNFTLISSILGTISGMRNGFDTTSSYDKYISYWFQLRK